MSGPLFSLRIDEQNTHHAVVTIFNRGANSGTLTILVEDLEELQRRLSAALAINQSVGTIEAGAKVTGVKIGRVG